VISEDGIIVEKYRDRKLLERYLESVALKYDMTLAELSLLLYRKDAGKALTRGAEAQMPAREDAVEATDRKDAGKALSRKDLAELMHMSRGDLRAALQKLVSRGMLEVVDVPRKRREAAEIAEATGLFGKRGEAQDADANGMTKKKREPRKIRLELLPASDAVLQDIAAAERLRAGEVLGIYRGRAPAVYSARAACAGERKADTAEVRMGRRTPSAMPGDESARGRMRCGEAQRMRGVMMWRAETWAQASRRR